MQTWTPVTEDRYVEMLEILPPAHWVTKGFLVGEPATHRQCAISKAVEPTFAAFLSVHGRCYEGREPMTIAEFKALDARAAVEQPRKRY